MTAGRPRGRVPHLLFGIALVLLMTMAAWWFVLLEDVVSAERSRELETLALRAHLVAARAGSDGVALVAGVSPDDPLIELVPVEAVTGEARALARTRQGLVARPLPSVLQDIDRRHARKRLMVYGEGTLLLLLVLACVGMLYRLVLAERRSADAIEAFFGRVTHEMKTPLAGLKALLQSLRAGAVPAERLAEVAQMGLRQAEHQEHLIENLLTGHRLATQAEVAPLDDVDLAQELAAFAAHRQQTMGAREPVAVTCEPGLRARANAASLGTILDNLADNAFKYGATRLTVSAGARSDRACIEVADDGEGFEPARASALFERFHREGASASGRHGTGLGLPIARSLAREMGGDLRATSAGPGRGATFVLDLLAPPVRSA